MQFSKCIKEIRNQANMSQEEFARNIGVSFATVNRWENDKTEPSFQTIKKIDSFCVNNSINFDIHKAWEEKHD